MAEDNRKKGCGTHLVLSVVMFGLGRFQEWIKTPTATIYINYILSSWGDRMWNFAIGIYLVGFEGSLILAAVLNFGSSGAILVLGGVLGNWVDNNTRLRAVRISLFVQNLSVALSAIVVVLFLRFDAQLHGAVRHSLEGVIIALAVVGSLASTAYRVAVEKDWIVVISDGNASKLANLNAVTRALDLLSKVLAPLCFGVILSAISLAAGAVFIAAWNVASVVLEYALLIRVYRLVPRLAFKDVSDSKEKPEQEMAELNANALLNGAAHDEPDETQSPKQANQDHKDGAGPSNKRKRKQKSCARMMADPFVTLVRGWRVYARQSVVFAGLALAVLYFTVLGGGTITVGYLYAQKLSSVTLGLAIGASGLTGLIAAFIFTRVRKRMGLERTGLLAFSLEIACLVLVVASVWAPGTIFDPSCLSGECHNEESPSTDCHKSGNNTLCTVQGPVSQDLNGTLEDGVKETAYSVMDGLNNSRTSNDTQATSPPHDRTSAALFLTGFITSRVGLWMADLTVMQLQQENVVEKDRGTVGGVQESVNMLLFMLIQVLTMVLPRVETFGVLIVLSFCAICLAGGLFVAHVCRVSGRAQPGDPTDQATGLAIDQTDQPA